MSNLNPMFLPLLAAIICFSTVTASAQPGSATNVAISAACMQALGVDCTKDPQQTNLFYDLMAVVNSKQIAASQSAIVQQYLIPALRRNPGMQAGVVNRAYKYVGKTAGSSEESLWTRQYETWQTYERLIPMLARAVAPVAAAPSVPQYSQQQQQQALQSAFQAIWGRMPTQSEAGMFTAVTPANMPGSVRSALSNYPGEAPRIVAAVFPSLIGRQPTDYERTGVIGVFGRYWTGADDLSTYLRNVTASYRTPNYGPNATPAKAVSAAPVTVPNVNSPGLVRPSGTPPVAGIIGINGGNAQNQGASVISTNSSNSPSAIIAQGGGNAISQNGSGVIGHDGASVVTHDGGSFHTLSVPAAPVAAPKGVCTNAQITSAILTVTGRAPNGSGAIGECDAARYGGGPWKTYADLVMKVRTAFPPQKGGK